MSDHAYKILTITGTSTNTIEEAVQNAIQRCGESVRNLRWFEVKETRGELSDGKIGHWQVTVDIGFTLEDPQ